jgi:HSP20 family molecular chaperone IbpA
MTEGTGVKRALATTEPQALLERMSKTFDSISKRAFEIFETEGRLFGRDLEHWFRAERELLHPVHVSMTETDQALDVRAEVPGFSEKELEITIEPTRLTIAGKRETKEEGKKGKTVYSEVCSNEILRVVDLPAEVDAEKATATVKSGVLSVTLPKSTKTKTIKIRPQAA